MEDLAEIDACRSSELELIGGGDALIGSAMPTLRDDRAEATLIAVADLMREARQ